ncbi:MAG: hypothetical protein Q7R47_06580 [Candidatus Diapherotrites archaeon]|nr:hypothetical protein [Candidatus Diapherotrites archaeon]
MGKGNNPGNRGPRARRAGPSGYSRQFLAWADSRGLKNGLRPSARIASNAHQPHVGKKGADSILSKRKASRGNTARSESGRKAQALAGKLFFSDESLPEKERLFLATKAFHHGVDFESRDQSVWLEVKSTKNLRDGGTFENIKALNGQLMNESANIFVLMTNKKIYLADGNRLRAFVKRHYALLHPRRIGADERWRLSFSINQLIDAGVLTTPYRDKQDRLGIQEWRFNKRTGRVIGRFANRIPLSAIVAQGPTGRTRRMNSRQVAQYDARLEDAPSRESMRARHRVRRRNGRNSI